MIAMTRWITCAGVVVSLLSVAGSAWAADDENWSKQTYVYKTVGPTKIEADVYRRNGDKLRPAVVWIHGGALITGNRQSVPTNILGLCREQNYVLVSIDYRLAPQVKLPEIIEDVKDAFRWIHTLAATELRIDPSKILVAGGSAGGYLTMMTGICARPRPKALVAYWGYGSVDSSWYTTPSAHYRQQPLVSREDADRAAAGEVITGSESRPRGSYYLYLRQNGLWTKEVTGFDPSNQRDQLDPFCPVRNITKDYPPILMVHGTSDTDVPFQESADMAIALEQHGVPHELIAVVGGGHGLGGGDAAAITDAHAKALDFIRRQLD